MASLPQLKAKQIIMDLHDEPNPEYEMMAAYFDKIDKIMVKSEYHKNLFSEKFHHKFIVIQNGLPDFYFNLNIPQKNPLKLIYASSYERGLYEILLWGFPIIKKEIPNIELHVFYGLKFIKDDLKEQLVPLLQQEGVFDHGRVSQAELLKEKLTSSIHYYIGCQTETDCISVKESVLASCIPIVSTNTVFGQKDRDYVVKIDGDPKVKDTHVKAANTIINLIKDKTYYKKTLKMISKNINKIVNWDNIGKEWSKLFIQLA